MERSAPVALLTSETFADFTLRPCGSAMTPDSVAELTCANESAAPARISASKMNNANTNWLRFITASQGCTRKTPLPLAVAGVAPPIRNGNTYIHTASTAILPRVQLKTTPESKPDRAKAFSKTEKPSFQQVRPIRD